MLVKALCFKRSNMPKYSVKSRSDALLDILHAAQGRAEPMLRSRLVQHRSCRTVNAGLMSLAIQHKKT
jgi:hypothetical protein